MIFNDEINKIYRPQGRIILPNNNIVIPEPVIASPDLGILGFRQCWDYLLEKEPLGMEGMTADYFKNVVIYEAKSWTMQSAAEILVPEMQKYMPGEVELSPLDDGGPLGVKIHFKYPDQEKIEHLVADDTTLEVLRDVWGPDCGFAVSKGVCDQLIAEHVEEQKQKQAAEQEEAKAKSAAASSTSVAVPATPKKKRTKKEK
jgi:hypothetical protein